MVDRRDAELVMRVKDLATAEFKKIATSVDSLNESLEAQVEAARTGKISLNELKDTLKQLQQAEQGLLQQQGLIDRFTKLSKAATDEAAALKKAQDALAAHAAKLAAGATASKTYANEALRLEKAVARAGTTLTSTQGKLNTTEKELRDVGIETRNLVTAQTQLINVAKQVGQSKTVLSGAIGNYARNVRLAREETTKLAQEERKAASASAGSAAPRAAAPRRGRGGETGLFGLRGFELQNLGYQVNDVITQLASGTGIGQVIGQQGGQIVQLFNKNLFDLIALIPKYSVVIGIATAATLAFFEAGRKVSSNREFRSELLATTSGLAFQAEALTTIRDKVRDYGVSWTDAGEAIKAAIGSGVAQDRIAQFLRLSQDIADRTGAKVPETFKSLVDGFSSGYDAIVKLNEQYGFMTAAQAEVLKGLFDEGRQVEANAKAFEMLAEKQRAAAEEGMGPWARALREVTALYRTFIGWLSNTAPIQALGRYYNWLATQIGSVTRALREAGTEGDRVVLENKLKFEENRAAGLPGIMRAQGRTPEEIAAATAGQAKTIAGLQAKLDELRKTNTVTSPSGALTEPTEADKIRVDAVIQGMKDEAEATKGLTTERKISLAVAKELRNLGDASPEQIDQIKKLVTAKVEQEETERRLAEALKRQTEAVKDGKNSSAIRLAGVRAESQAYAEGARSVEALNKAREEGERQERERLNQAEREGRKGASQAKALFSQESSLQTQLAALSRAGGARGLTDVDDRLREIDERFASIARNIQKFRQAGGSSIGGMSIGDFETKVGEASERAKSFERLKSAEEAVNQTIQERNLLVQTYNNLAQVGAISQSEAQERVKAAYESTTPEIEKAVAALEKLVNASDLPARTTELYRAKIEQFRSQAQYLDPLMANIRNNFEQAFSSSMVSGIQSITEEIANLTAGTAAWSDVLQTTGKVALNVLASIARSIAEVIFKFYAAEAASAFLSGGKTNTIGLVGKVLGLAGGLLGAGAGAGAFSAGGAGVSGAVGTVPTGAGAGSFFVAHQGGVVGRLAATRHLPYDAFAHAPRYHSGGLPGLRPDEEAAVLQKGEEVLSRDDPRNVMKGGGGSSIAIRNVLVMDPEAIPGAMAGASGERVIMTAIQKNAAAVRQLVRA